MNKIQIKDNIHDRVLFEYECDDNNIKKTLEKAVSQDVCLAFVIKN